MPTTPAPDPDHQDSPRAASEDRAPDESDVVVIGGGVAGLTAAITATRHGARVVLLEARNELGGRARSTDVAGARFNLGPHALYRGGAAMSVLRDLGMEPEGSVPAGPQFALADGELHGLPATAGSLLRTTLLGKRDKAAFAAVLAKLPRTKAHELDSTTVDDFIDASSARPGVRRLLHALVRVSTYGADHDIASAGAAVRQLQMAVSDNVLYLDRGWQQLVDALHHAAVIAGVDVCAGVDVESVLRVERGVEVRAGAATYVARAVVVATPPDVADRLCRTDGVLAKAAGPPVRAAVLDVVSRTVPERRFVLGLDEPTYASVHGPPARLVETGSATVCARYLRDGEEHAAAGTREELRSQRRLLGIDDVDVIEERYLHRLTVAGGQPIASSGGQSGRPGIDASGLPGVFVAGDWVGDEGLLADAGFASASLAGRLAASTSAV